MQILAAAAALGSDAHAGLHGSAPRSAPLSIEFHLCLQASRNGYQRCRASRRRRMRWLDGFVKWLSQSWLCPSHWYNCGRSVCLNGRGSLLGRPEVRRRLGCACLAFVNFLLLPCILRCAHISARRSVLELTAKRSLADDRILRGPDPQSSSMYLDRNARSGLVCKFERVAKTRFLSLPRLIVEPKLRSTLSQRQLQLLRRLQTIIFLWEADMLRKFFIVGTSRSARLNWCPFF